MKSNDSSSSLRNNRLIGQVQVTLMLALVFVVSYILFKSGDEQTTLTFMRWYIGVFMLAFAAVKLLDYKMFVLAFSTYDFVAKRAKAYANIYPFVILGLSGLYLIDILPYFRNIATLIVASVASIGVIQDVYIQRNQLSCGILGRVIRLPFTTMSLIESAALVGMSVLSLFLL
ncbi:MAG: MauE/DoxX family redox-associated membrane protein [Candidatus Saccharimonadales bacterium]